AGETQSRLRWATVTAYLTANTDPEAERLSEETWELGPEWANRSITMNISSPGEGTYFVHLEGDLEFANSTSEKFISTSTQPVRFGSPSKCKDVQTVAFSTNKPCPVLFPRSGTIVNSPAFAAHNKAVINSAVEQIEALCKNGTLHR